MAEVHTMGESCWPLMTPPGSVAAVIQLSFSTKRHSCVSCLSTKRAMFILIMPGTTALHGYGICTPPLPCLMSPHDNDTAVPEVLRWSGTHYRESPLQISLQSAAATSRGVCPCSHSETSQMAPTLQLMDIQKRHWL